AASGEYGPRRWKRPGRPGRFRTAVVSGSELVAEGQHGRPARDAGVVAVAVGFLDTRIVRVAGEVVDVLAGFGINARVVGHAAGRVEAVVVDLAAGLVQQVAEVHDVHGDVRLVVFGGRRHLLAAPHVEGVC